MSFANPTMSHPKYTEPSPEDWEDLVDWTNNFFQDPYVAARQGNDSLAYHVPGSIAAEQCYVTSTHASVLGEPSSLEYAVSVSPSIVDNPSSFSQAYGTSPTFSSTATSPLVGRDDTRYLGSFGTWDGFLSPLREDPEPSVLDTRFDRIVDSPVEANPDLYVNPYGAISRLDVSASAFFAQAGTWVDQPQIIEPIAECDEHLSEIIPSPTVQSKSRSFNGSAISCPRSQQLDTSRSRAIAIPQPNRQSGSYNSARSQPQWTATVPPVLSVSPTTHRTRGATLSRTSSRAESRRKMATPSPTSSTSLSWVSCQMDSQTKKLAFIAAEGSQGRAIRGRKRGLTADQRSQAALMRIVGACSNCRKRKEKCDPGTPCNSCLEHYKGDLVQHPCRDRLLSDLSKAFLAERLGWHPTARSLESCVAPNRFDILTDVPYIIPLNFGFGPSLRVPVHAIDIKGDQTLTHEHVVYSWPPKSSFSSTHVNTVLPAILTVEATATLTSTLDAHLSQLVTNPIHFRSFPLFCSPLQILRDVYLFFCSLPTSSSHSALLHRALKLLVLVHIGGDLTVPLPTEDASLARLVRLTTSLPADAQPTPCLIRAQFGAVMPGLATHLMQSILADFEQILLARRPNEWPFALAVLLTVLMTLESVHYHAAKAPYHRSASRHPSPHAYTADVGTGAGDDAAVDKLLAFYSACFVGCHARLRPEWDGDASARPGQPRVSAEDQFVASVRGAMRRAGACGYLARKAGERRDEGDMEFFFDRLVVRVLGLGM